MSGFQFKLAEDAESHEGIEDFRTAAHTLKGSRDTGAQLYCALLRSAGVEARLVCSLQPLSFSASGKGTMPVTATPSPAVTAATPDPSDVEEIVDLQGSNSPFQSRDTSDLGMPFSARRRLGHPHAAGYHVPEMSIPLPRPKPKPKPRPIRESPYPIFWVEALDKAHQKWIPVDALVSESVAKPRQFEPPASDSENNMSYVVAFDEEGTAKDVTRRYAKAFNAKTRKLRVDSADGSEKWWRKALRIYSRGFKTDADQAEDDELAVAEAREPMPKNVADFKDHPVYALERHLRRNEVLINRHETGRVATGKDSTGGKKKLESVYRRSDVRLVKSADAWYRVGREIKIGEQPVKIVAAKKQDDMDAMDGEVESSGTGLYTEDQTELYNPPPVVNGRVPRNAYGNLDVYVPSMVPRGGVHIPCKSFHPSTRLG
jgi:xeroderma pigmentosum group C-complementing protein